MSSTCPDSSHPGLRDRSTIFVTLQNPGNRPRRCFRPMKTTRIVATYRQRELGGLPGHSERAGIILANASASSSLCHRFSSMRISSLRFVATPGPLLTLLSPHTRRFDSKLWIPTHNSVHTVEGTREEWHCLNIYIWICAKSMHFHGPETRSRVVAARSLRVMNLDANCLGISRPWSLLILASSISLRLVLPFTPPGQHRNAPFGFSSSSFW